MPETEAQQTANHLLQSSLALKAKKNNIRDLEIAHFSNGSFNQAGVNLLADATDVRSYRARAGCLTKWMTCVLVARAASEGKFGFSDKLIDLIRELHLTAVHVKRLEQIRIHHLLSHSHGLDDSRVAELPVQVDGMIDLDALFVTLLDTPSLTSPGNKFNYGNAGIWIAAGLLELAYGVSYRQLLSSLFRDAGVSCLNLEINSMMQGPQICPATGTNLRLSATDWVLLIRYIFKLAEDCAEYGNLWGMSYVPSGWQWHFRKVCLGLNEYGEGWYGHNAKMNGDSAIVRLCPEKNIAVAITASTEEGAYAILNSLFVGLLPEFANRSSPKYMLEAEWLTTQSSCYIGKYENAALSIQVDVAANRSLYAKVFRKRDFASGSSAPYIKRFLRPTTDGIFFSNPPEPLVIPYVQFLEQESDGKFGYIQNGRQIFRRVVDHSA